MDTNRVKRAAQWYYTTVFHDEEIAAKKTIPEEKVPPLIRAARSLENRPGSCWQSREEVFVKQGKLLATYEDDYHCTTELVRYYPTYSSFTDEELRIYFTWRTKLRQGQAEKTCLSFAFLYVYELLNQIGTQSPEDGYEKLCNFRNVYGPIDEGILFYLNRWITDYVIYYDLPPELLAGTAQVKFDRAISVFDRLPQSSREDVIDAISFFTGRWLNRSKFYSRCKDEMDEIIVGVLKRVWNHCASGCKKTMVEQYFGTAKKMTVRLFDSAVFFRRKRESSFRYEVDAYRVYTLEKGVWSEYGYQYAGKPGGKIEEVIRLIDCRMREAWNYKYPIKEPAGPKWLTNAIDEEILLLKNKKQREKECRIDLDPVRLEKIRMDAAAARDRLIEAEESEEQAFLPEIKPEGEKPEPTLQQDDTADCLLDDTEYRLLSCLLYRKGTEWVQKEGKILSVLVDGINEKLYDSFLDTVILLEEQPLVVEDYEEELKRMVHP